MIFAKLSTAKTILFGPVLDANGAEYTGAVVGDVKICKNNGTPAALNASATLTHKEVGLYELALTQSDISEVGVITLVLSKTTYVAAPVRINVVPEKVYDSLIGGSDNLEVDAIQLNASATAAANLAKAADTMAVGTVDTGGFSPTATEFEANDITEATADHFKGLLIKFVTGPLAKQGTKITAYSLVSGRGHFTVDAMTEAPASGNTFEII